MNKLVKRTLSIYPNRLGFGYVLLEGPRILVDYGICNVRPVSNDKVMRRLEKIVATHQPTVVVLRDAGKKSSKRIKRLIGRISDLMADKDIPVYMYSGEQVKNAFSQFGAKTKYQIALKIIGEFDELKERAPKPRKAWLDEDYNMGIFDAMAMIGTHHFLTGQY